MHPWIPALLVGVLFLLVASVAEPPSQARGNEGADEQAHREQSARNLRKLGIAMHHYQNEQKALPQASSEDARGKALLSWRVAILPYLEEKKLYDEFRRDEPWDSEHNQKLLDKMPAFFAAPGVKTKEKHLTYYQVFVGPDTPFAPAQRRRLREWTMGDGTSNTVMLVEAGEAVPWTRPADLSHEMDKELPKLGGMFKHGFHACFGDCSIYFIKRQIPERLMHQLIGWNDGRNEDTADFLERIRIEE